MKKIEIPDNLSVSQLIDMLKDPLSIPSPSFFPLGVFWIIIVFLVASYIGYRIVFPKSKSLAMRFLAKNEFKKIFIMMKDEKNHHKVVLNLANMVRRVGIVVFGNEAIANLHSKSWAEFIYEHDKSKELTVENADILAQAPYKNAEYLSVTDIDSLYKQSYNWAMAWL